MENISHKEAMPEIELETYKRDTDKAALVAGIADLQEVERAITDTRRPGLEVAEQYVSGLEREVAEKRGSVFVARLDGEVIGFIACWIEQDDNVAETPASTTYGYISDAYVVPEYRSRGVFGRLNQKAEEYLSQFPEVQLIRSNVVAGNVPALKAYERAGYKPEEVRLVKKVDKSDR